MKRVASILLALCLLLSVLSVQAAAWEGAAEAQSLAFGDVPVGAWYEEAVGFVSQRGLMGGVGSGMFDPSGTTSRSQLVTILYRLEGEPAVADGSAFQDVNTGDYFCKAVQWASTNGVVNGVGDGKFAPANLVTREQTAAILHRYAKLKKYDTSKTASLAAFTDFDAIGSYAGDSMRWANASGLMSGVGGDRIAPLGQTSRAEMAVVLMRFCENTVGTTGSGDPAKIPVNFEMDGETVFTVYMPAHWAGNVETKMDESSGEATLTFYDKPNRDKDSFSFPGNFMALCLSKNYSAMPHPNKKLLNTIEFHGQRYDVVRTGPTDVRFDTDSAYLTNSYKEKEMDADAVVGSIVYSDAVKIPEKPDFDPDKYASIQDFLDDPEVAEQLEGMIADLGDDIKVALSADGDRLVYTFAFTMGVDIEATRAALAKQMSDPSFASTFEGIAAALREVINVSNPSVVVSYWSRDGVEIYSQEYFPK